MTAAASSSPGRVVDAILAGIRAGRYVPGQRLIEADLTRELGVSRGPVREAFKHLAGEGVLAITRHRGAFIRAQSRDEVHDTMVVLETLTGLAARLAAENIDEGDNRAHFEAAYSRLLTFENSGETLGYLEARRHFYAALLDVADNHELARVMPQMQINLLRLQFQSYMTAAEHARQIAEYCSMGQAILNGEPAAAERATRKHLRRRRESLISLPDAAYASARNDSNRS